MQAAKNELGEQEQLIEKYVLNQLSEQEATEFEAFFLSNQQCLDQLELTEKLYQGFGLMGDLPAHQSQANKQAANDNSWWQRQVPAWSLAVMLLLTVVPTGYLYQQNQQLNTPAGNIAMVNIAMSQLRGQETPAIKIHGGDKRVILSAYIDSQIHSSVYAAYGFELRDQRSGAIIWQVLDLQLGDDGMLFIDLGHDYLKAGRYGFAVFGVLSGGEKELLRDGGIVKG
ncbi:MAG: hypothetical protein ACI8WB_006269 [Phenylobacterium sp.]|jgi:hypothetical protein